MCIRDRLTPKQEAKRIAGWQEERDKWAGRLERATNPDMRKAIQRRIDAAEARIAELGGTKPAPLTAPPGRVPWTMTRGEYLAATVPEGADHITRLAAEDLHERLVNEAVRAGKNVPKRVLADYPDAPPLRESPKAAAALREDTLAGRGEESQVVPEGPQGALALREPVRIADDALVPPRAAVHQVPRSLRGLGDEPED